MKERNGVRSAAHRAISAAAVLRGTAPPPPLRVVPDKPKPARQAVQENVDATPERIDRAVEHCDDGEHRHYRIVDAVIDKAGERARLTRRFADSWIDRMRARGQLTYAQWYACDWYLALHASAFASARVVADYGASVGGAGSDVYGQPRSERQWAARQRLRQARAALPSNMLTLFDMVVLEDAMPAFNNGRQRARFASAFARAVQPLAEWLNAPGAQP